MYSACLDLAAPVDNAGFYLFLAVAFGWIAAIAGRLDASGPYPDS
jgi:hypothetical protein